MVRDLTPEISALLTILGETPSPERTVSIVSETAESLTIAGAPLMVLSAPVRIVQDDHLWLGEVVECHLDGTAKIKVRHTLNNLAELRRRVDYFSGRYAMLTPECPEKR